MIILFALQATIPSEVSEFSKCPFLCWAQHHVHLTPNRMTHYSAQNCLRRTMCQSKTLNYYHKKKLRIWNQWQEVVISQISTLALRSTQPPINGYLKVTSSKIGIKLSEHTNNYHLLKNAHRQNITQLFEHYA